MYRGEPSERIVRKYERFPLSTVIRIAFVYLHNGQACRIKVHIRQGILLSRIVVKEE